ncbi:diguanylate cyclase domain-containing protein [Mycobacterium sp. pW049]|uniref:diguanylate cyclase domain-containing protein n=1 Tax=[Mycobacterium] bulgaricum TaxID=3238985 RepID=UPI00351B0EEE
MTVVCGIVVLNLVGWSTGNELLTRGSPMWPHMTPWTALLLCALAGAVGLQLTPASKRRIRIARGLAATVGLLTLVTLVEYLTNAGSHWDTILFRQSVLAAQPAYPGRPSPQTAATLMMLAAAAAAIGVHHKWGGVVRSLGVLGGVGTACFALAAYMFDAANLVSFTTSSGQAMATAIALLLLATATAAARPDALPLSWILARPDHRSLLRLLGVLAGFPIVVALLRFTLLGMGLEERAVWPLSVALGSLGIGALTFYYSQREQRLLMDRGALHNERLMAEERFRMLADNAVDVILHLRGRDVAWVSPSVESALGERTPRWIGSDFSSRIHPVDRPAVEQFLTRITGGESVHHRFRICSASDTYHWVDGHGKPYVDGDGATDGLIAALRIVDDQVEAQRQLERLARFDTLTGLVNRAEFLARLESELSKRRESGRLLGVLFCDVDRFKSINDTWGHGTGDVVLTTLAVRIAECVRETDTVGRTGGDEIIVLLPDLRGIHEAAEIAEAIRRRTAEPINAAGAVIHATLSIGATIAAQGEDVGSITARADMAMYRAKFAGKNSVVCVEASEG